MAIEQVRSLVADRHRYESWLEALDARRDETPERVYARVRDDYAGRRAEVLAQLQALLPDMISLREAREQHLRDLEQQLANLEDERAEAMLRTAVGEFDSERWDAVRIDVEAKLLAIGEERDALLIEVDEIRTLIEQSRDDMAVVAEESMSASDADAPMIIDDVEESEDVAPRLETDAHAVSVVDEEAVAVDAITDVVSGEPLGGIPSDAWLEDATDISNDVGTPVAPPAAADAVTMESAIESLLLDTEAPVLPPAAPAEAVASAATDEWDEALAVFDGKPAVGSEPAVPATPAPAGSASPDPFDDLAFLRSIMDPAETPAPSLKTPAEGTTAVPDQQAAAGTDSQKSLRCAECGTMNAPTEWYCERCGGELITI
ncbi:MAG: hypothetical protein RLZZ621_2509 [Gemmatimonadota bacterium]